MCRWASGMWLGQHRLSDRDSELRAPVAGYAPCATPPSSSQRRSGSVRRSLSADLLLLPPLALSDAQARSLRDGGAVLGSAAASASAASPPASLQSLPSSAHRPSTLRTHLRLPSRLCCTVGPRPAAQGGRALAPPVSLYALGVFWYLGREFRCWLGVSLCSFLPSSASYSYWIVPTAHSKCP